MGSHKWYDGVDLGDDEVTVEAADADSTVVGGKFLSPEQKPHQGVDEEQNGQVNLSQYRSYPPYALLAAALSAQFAKNEKASIRSTKKGYGALKEESEDKPRQLFYYGPTSEGFDAKTLLPDGEEHMPLKVLQDIRDLQNRELELLAYQLMTYNTKHARKYLEMFQDLVQQRNEIFDLIERKYILNHQNSMNQKQYDKLRRRFAKAYGKVHSKLSKAQRGSFSTIFNQHNDCFLEYLGCVKRGEHKHSGMSGGAVVFVSNKNWHEGLWASYYEGTLEDPHKVFYMTREATSILDVNMDVVLNAVQACHRCISSKYEEDDVIKKMDRAIISGEGPLAYLNSVPNINAYLNKSSPGTFTRLKPATNIFQRTIARLKRFNDTTSVYALSASKVNKYRDSFAMSNRQNILIRFYKGTRLIIAAVTAPIGVVTLKALDLLTGKSIFCLRKTAKTLRSLKNGYRVKRNLFKLAGMGAGSLTAAVIGGGCGMGIAWGIGAVGIASYGTALPAYAAWLIGASVGGTLGLSVGAYSGWMTSKYIAKIVSKVFRNDTNPDKSRLTKKERRYLAGKDFDLDQVEKVLSSLYNEKHEKTILSRVTPNGMAKKRKLNRRISDIKRGLRIEIDLEGKKFQLRKDRDPVKSIQALGGEPREKAVPAGTNFEEDTTIPLDISSSVGPEQHEENLLDITTPVEGPEPPPVSANRDRNISQVPPAEPLPPGPEEGTPDNVVVASLFEAVSEEKSEGERKIKRMREEEGMDLDAMSAALRETALLAGEGDQDPDDHFVPPPPPSAKDEEEADTAPLLGEGGIVEVTSENPVVVAGMFAHRGRSDGREGSCHSGVRSRSPSPVSV